MMENKQDTNSMPPPQGGQGTRHLKRLVTRPLFWVLTLLTMVVALYVLTWWGYRHSFLPFWFDNTVQSSGIWRIYGKKVYYPTASDTFEIVDPSLTSVVESTVSRYVVTGYLGDFSVDGEKLVDIEIITEGEDPLKINGSYSVESVYKLGCVDTKDCSAQIYRSSSLDSLVEGEIVKLVFEKKYGEEEWIIEQLLMGNVYE